MPQEILTKQLVAVIDIGSSAIRMLVGEVGPKAEVKPIDNLHKPASLGRDVFTNGKISNQTIRNCVETLKGFKAILDEYGVKKIHAIATSAVREASNRDILVDQVFVRTGIDIEVIEGAEENRLDLIAVEHAFQGSFDFQKKNSLIIEISSGSTELIILNHGEVELTRTLSIGSIRLPEQVVAGKTKTDVVQRILKRSIRGIAENAAREFSLGEIDTFIALGGDVRLAAHQVKGDDKSNVVTLSKKEFLKFVDSISKLTPEEITTQYSLPYSDAETLYPSLLIYSNFLNETKSDEVLVPMVSIREALLLEFAQMLSHYKRTDLSRQVVNSAKKLGKKFFYNELHAMNVSQNSIKIFDYLKSEHGMGSRERLLLEVAAILHDIGMYIAVPSHHKHSSYLIDAADLFGLRKADKDIVSNVARYHRRSPPQITHVNYASLSKPDRAIVLKLASILRIADCLDRSHQQKIKNFDMVKTSDAYEIWLDNDLDDISNEREGISKKGTMFSDVFGLPVILKQGKPVKS